MDLKILKKPWMKEMFLRIFTFSMVGNLLRALVFLGLSPMNREFGAFLMSNLGRRVMTENKLSIHVESGYIFYENHNTANNFYNFLLAQQNDDVSQFLQAFSIDDVEKYDLFTHKNSKYLFYRFSDYIKTYGNSRHKIKHTRKMLDTVGIQKIEEKRK